MTSRLTPKRVHCQTVLLPYDASQKPGSEKIAAVQVGGRTPPGLSVNDL